MAILTIARLTILEASRRRLLVALVVLTLVVVGLVGFGFSKLPSVGGRRPLNHDDLNQVAGILTILTFFMFSFVLSFAAVFVSAPAISSDVESGVILAIVPRPIRRSDIVIGRWLGLCLSPTRPPAGGPALRRLTRRSGQPIPPGARNPSGNTSMPTNTGSTT